MNQQPCLDNRSLFANRICKLIYQKHDGNIDEAIKEAEPFFEDLHEHVRNIYELIPTEIPLMYYRDLLKFGKDNYYDISEQEYQKIILFTKNKCVEQYS